MWIQLPTAKHFLSSDGLVIFSIEDVLTENFVEPYEGLDRSSATSRQGQGVSSTDLELLHMFPVGYW